jgi:hypothetical protein
MTRGWHGVSLLVTLPAVKKKKKDKKDIVWISKSLKKTSLLLGFESAFAMVCCSG